MCHLQKLHDKFEDKGLVILGFNWADDKKIALDFMAENGATFPTILDCSEAAENVSFKDYRGSGVPLNYIIDREGKVVDAWYGYEEGHPRALAALEKTGGGLGAAIRQDANARVERSANEVAAAAQRLFEAIRTTDYNHDWWSKNEWERLLAKDVLYNPSRGDPSWVRWICAKFKANPIVDVRLGKVFADAGGQPAVHFELRLKDGEVLQGDLQFHWDSEKKHWIGREGLDWHIPNPKPK